MRQLMIKIILVLLICFPMMCHASDLSDFNRRLGKSGWSPVVHVGVGAVTSKIAVSFIPEKWELHPLAEQLIGISAALAVGGIIESFDKNFDTKDVLHYGAGAVLFSWDF